MLKVKDINITNLKRRTLERELPEFYSLERCIENFPPWHYNESVYEHTLCVLKELKDIFKRKDSNLQEYLKVKPFNHYKRKDLLYLASFFHDIGKPETLVKEGEDTSCPRHEHVSAEKSEKILDRFDLFEEEKDKVFDIIGKHGFFCIAQYEDEQASEEAYNLLRLKLPDIFLDMLLFELADTKALKVGEDAKKKVNFMMNFYEKQIKDYFLSLSTASM